MYSDSSLMHSTDWQLIEFALIYQILWHIPCETVTLSSHSKTVTPKQAILNRRHSETVTLKQSLWNSHYETVTLKQSLWNSHSETVTLKQSLWNSHSETVTLKQSLWNSHSETVTLKQSLWNSHSETGNLKNKLPVGITFLAQCESSNKTALTKKEKWKQERVKYRRNSYSPCHLINLIKYSGKYK